MRSGLGGAGRVLMLVAITTGSVALGGLPATTAGAATAPPETTATRLAGTVRVPGWTPARQHASSQ